MNKKIVFGIIILILIVVGLTYKGNKTGNEIVKIGVLTPLSGPIAVAGEVQKNALAMAQKDNPNAKKFEHASWEEYRSIISSDWNPGMNLPFDPIASKEAEELGLEVSFIGGHNIESLNDYLSGESFSGTIIK
jgi:hypothetical protein